MSESNKQARLAARPSGMPTSSDWEITTEDVPSPGDREFVVQVSDISVDPAMRGWMNAGASYIEPVEIGAVMRAGAVGKIVESSSSKFAVGDHVFGEFGVQEYAVSNGKGVIKIDPRLAPPRTFLGALGFTGMTAYFGLLDVGKMQAGETVVISGAAGAVGTIAGQIAKIAGCRVIGIAGGPVKCKYLVDELGFDAAIDYKSDNVKGALREQAPGGIDVYFDNVGGDILEAALSRMARGGRIVISGAVSQYNATEAMVGPANYMALLVSRSSMTGFVIFDYVDRFPQAMGHLAGWLQDGRLVSPEHVVAGGIDAFPETLLMLFDGRNTGKLILSVEEA